MQLAFDQLTSTSLFSRRLIYFNFICVMFLSWGMKAFCRACFHDIKSRGEENMSPAVGSLKMRLNLYIFRFSTAHLILRWLAQRSRQIVFLSFSLVVLLAAAEPARGCHKYASATPRQCKLDFENREADGRIIADPGTPDPFKNFPFTCVTSGYRNTFSRFSLLSLTFIISFSHRDSEHSLSAEESL